VTVTEGKVVVLDAVVEDVDLRHVADEELAAEALAPVQEAIRLSPRDPELYVWYFVLCHAHTHLPRDAQAIEWCGRSIATGKTFWFAYVDLASAYAWRGQDAEAAAAVAELLKLRPGYTVQKLAEEGSGLSSNPTLHKEYEARIG
jgi:tetratricopeptide (TPR) repeat protein